MNAAIFNPNDKPIDELPVIYGFNNGGPEEWLHAVLLAEDGTFLGSHICSHEGFMPYDLGIEEGWRADRHNTFRGHYPDGYRMEFVGASEVRSHHGLMAAYRRNQEQAPAPAADSPEPERKIIIPCLYCRKPLEYAPDSLTAQGVFNSFCSDNDCEDRFAATL